MGNLPFYLNGDLIDISQSKKFLHINAQQLTLQVEPTAPQLETCNCSTALY